MDASLIMHIGRRTMETCLIVCAPVLIITLVLGVVVAMLQAVTSLRDMTLGMVVKLAAVGLTLLVFGAWMLETTGAFTREVFQYMERMGH
jgi:flagellar biosynthetic protein FliQ